MHTNGTDMTNRIWNYIQGQADAELEAHLQTCQECQHELETLNGLFALRTIEDVPPVPGTLMSTLNGLMEKVRPDLVRQAPAGVSVMERIRTIVAELLQDTALNPQIAGLRGETSTRQIAFTSDVADLDLEVSPADDEFLVVGQLGMDEIPQDLHIRFVQTNNDARSEAANTALLSNQGHFRLNVAPGTWDISVEIDDAIVMFPGIQL